MRRFVRSICASFFAAAMALAVLTGCENNSDVVEDDNGSEGVLSVSPASVKLTAANPTNVVLTASGGAGDYKWTLASEETGSVTAKGTWAVYTSKNVVGANAVTVTDRRGNSATTRIVQN